MEIKAAEFGQSFKLTISRRSWSHCRPGMYTSDLRQREDIDPGGEVVGHDIESAARLQVGAEWMGPASAESDHFLVFLNFCNNTRCIYKTHPLKPVRP